MATIGDQQLALSDDYAEALDMLSNRAVDNTKAALVRSLKRTLKDLRRYYSDFIDPELKKYQSADGKMRRPMSYSIADSNAKMVKLLQIAQEYFPEQELNRITAQYKKDFGEAVQLGGDLGKELAQLVDSDGKGNSMFVGASKEAVIGAANTASAYIRREVETFRDDIARIVQDGIGRGKSSKALEKDIRVALLGAKDPNNITPKLGLLRRAELIARSELANAYTGAQKAAAARNGYKYGRFIATQDERTCPYCASRHGKIYLLSEMTGTLHPRCVLGDTKVSPGPFSAVMRGWYRGNIVTIRLDDGSSQSVTGHHPVLTTDGIKPACALSKGDNLIGDRINILSDSCSEPDFHQVPACAENIFAALVQSGAMPAVSVPVSPLDLHGDGVCIDGKIEIVRSTSLLEGYWKTATGKNAGEGNSASRYMAFRQFSTLRLPDLTIFGLGGAACGSMSILSEAQSVLAGGLSHAEIHRITTSAWRNPSLTQPVVNDTSTNKKLLGKCFDAFPGLVQTHNIIDIQMSEFSGHVYSFETFCGYYYTGSQSRIVNQNCRCSLSPVSDLAVEETDPELRRELLREDFWEKERNNVWKKFADTKEWPFEKASKVLEDHLKKPSASEKRLYPDIKEAPKPVA
jgi:SPP1 gp7 family putative phage head morphogenesis protein